ncbi:unnamed protein product [Oikopleura dioica]|uniref:Uncharacterized protein n=1 Tax=Oikopleura dioica TaxID=34765 RepID=E4XQK7_OIKDI|nr:unnamed protein product [Oikopleura dioica]
MRFIFLFFIFIISAQKAGPAERLKKKLFETNNYNSNIRPQKNHTEPVLVKFRPILNEIINVNEVAQKLDIKFWFHHEWIDERLSWDPKDYGNVATLHVPQDFLWLPDYALYGNADGDFIIAESVRVRIFSNGTVMWRPPIITKTFCEIQVANFPFDSQNCSIKIGSWTGNTFLLQTRNFDVRYDVCTCCEPIDLSTYNINGEWEMFQTGCWRHVLFYGDLAEGYEDVTHYIVLKRRPRYLILNIIIPTIVFSLLSCAVFYLPAEEAEKITLCISVLLSLVTFFLVIVDSIPQTARAVPKLGIYILFTMILNTVSILLTIVVENMHHRGPETHEMSPWIRTVFIDLLPRLLFSSTMKKMDVYGPKPPKISDVFKGTYQYRAIAKLAGTENETDPILLNPEVQDAIRGVEYMAKSFKEQEFNENSKAEWKYVAFVLDHCLLIVFITTCVLGSAIIFGENCMDLLRAMWYIQRDDEYLRSESLWSDQDLCFKYLSSEDQRDVLAASLALANEETP